MLILMAMWNAGGRLPDDDAKLARVARLSLKRWRAISVDLLSFFEREAGEIGHKRLTRELHKAQVKSEARAAAGARGGTATALKTKAHAAATRALGHWEVAVVVRQVCCVGGSIKSLAEQTGEGRDVVTKLLKVGLDLLAVHYGMMMGR